MCLHGQRSGPGREKLVLLDVLLRAIVKSRFEKLTN